MMGLGQKLITIVLVSIVCIGCDQSTKLLAKDRLQSSGTHSYWNDTFRLSYSENSGAVLGMGDSLPPEVRTMIFQGVVSLLLIALLVFMIRSRSLSGIEMFSLSLLLAGGFSNLLDRLTNDGAVVDFLNLGIGSVRTGIFNVADMVILLGAGILILAQSRSSGSEVR